MTTLSRDNRIEGTTRDGTARGLSRTTDKAMQAAESTDELQVTIVREVGRLEDTQTVVATIQTVVRLIVVQKAEGTRQTEEIRDAAEADHDGEVDRNHEGRGGPAIGKPRMILGNLDSLRLRLEVRLRKRL